MRAQKGFSLLEVLITLIVVSVGLLGIASILVNSLKNNYNSYALSQANILANDMLERVRANKKTAVATPSPYALGISGAVPAAATGTQGEAAAELAEWRAALSKTLPSGTGSVTVTSAGKVQIVVQWNSSRVAGASSTQKVTLESNI